MAADNETIPPVGKVREAVTGFMSRVPVWSVTVFTVDGYIIAHHSSSETIPEGLEMAIASLSAGLITIAEDFIRMVDPSKLFKMALVDSVDERNAPGFSAILGHVAQNVLLSCLFARTTQLGLVTFELEGLANEIREIVNEWEVKLHSETMT